MIYPTYLDPKLINLSLNQIYGMKVISLRISWMVSLTRLIILLKIKCPFTFKNLIKDSRISVKIGLMNYLVKLISNFGVIYNLGLKNYWSRTIINMKNYYLTLIYLIWKKKNSLRVLKKMFMKTFYRLLEHKVLDSRRFYFKNLKNSLTLMKMVNQEIGKN